MSQTRRLLKLQAQGVQLVAQTGPRVPVEYAPRQRYDSTPWRAVGSDVRYSGLEVGPAEQDNGCRAVVLANQWAEQFRAAGFKAEVIVTRHEGIRYGDGTWMIPPRVSARLSVDGRDWFEESLHLCWQSSVEGRRTTKFLFGTVYRPMGKTITRTRWSQLRWTVDGMLGEHHPMHPQHERWIARNKALREDTAAAREAYEEQVASEQARHAAYHAR